MINYISFALLIVVILAFSRSRGEKNDYLRALNRFEIRFNIDYENMSLDEIVDLLMGYFSTDNGERIKSEIYDLVRTRFNFFNDMYSDDEMAFAQSFKDNWAVFIDAKGRVRARRKGKRKSVSIRQAFGWIKNTDEVVEVTQGITNWSDVQKSDYFKNFEKRKKQNKKDKRLSKAKIAENKEKREKELEDFKEKESRNQKQEDSEQ